MKLRSYFIFNLGLVFIASFCNHVTAQTLPKDSTAVIREQQPIPHLLAPPTNSVLDGVSLPHPGALTFPTPSSYVSPWLLDIVKLVRARIDDAVIVTFIDSAGTFNLDAEQVIYLRDLGLSAEVISIMIQHDGEIISGLRPIPAAPSASPATVHLAPGEPKISQAQASSILSFPVDGQDASAQKALPKIPENNGQPSEGPLLPNDRGSEESGNDVTFLPIRISPPPLTISPVRQPYPVQLLDPIVMIRAQGRPANLMILEMR
jgi:hypothetical protein